MDNTLQDLVVLRTKLRLLHKKILDQAEIGFGDHEKWQLLRSAINDAFGDRGLNSELTRITNSYIERKARVRS